MNQVIKEIKENQKQLVNKIRKEHDTWDSIEFRHNHIAYCELRGRLREKIERPKDSHKPDEKWIARLKEEWLKRITNMTMEDIK